MKKAKNAIVGAAVVGIALFVFFSFTNNDPGISHEKRIEQQFSPLNGEHINLTKQIKDAMPDPGSYQHKKTVFTDKDTVVIISQTFTGTNAAGEVVEQTVKAKADTLGNIIEIMQTF